MISIVDNKDLSHSEIQLLMQKLKQSPSTSMNFQASMIDESNAATNL